MAFCKFSNEFLIKNKTAVDNSFIALFLPELPPVVVKVYLYGLYLSENPHAKDNSIEEMAKVLKLSESEIIEAYKILEAERLVQIENINNFNVIYVDAPDFISSRKFGKEKYEKFNVEMQNLFLGSRMLTQTEYERYYEVIEDYKIDEDALLLIAKYAIETKGKNVGYPYIVTIAKNWANEGIKTVKDANEKLIEQERSLGKLHDILSALKITRIASIDEREKYIDWKKKLGLTDEVILFATKFAKNSFNKLDANLTKYSTMGLLTTKEIEAFEKNKKQILELTKTIVKNLGLYYENSEPVIETYLTPWLNLGFSEDFLVTFSRLCFKQNVRTLEGMDTKLKTLYKKGILTIEALDELNSCVAMRDAKIKEVLNLAGLVREVTNFDRSMFNTWTTSWEMDFDVICYVATLAKDTLNPMQYINKILKDYKSQNISTIEQAKNVKSLVSSVPKNKKVNTTGVMQHEYSANELNSLFANIDEVNND